MATQDDLIVELGDLNENARQLLEKYSDVFAELAAKKSAALQEINDLLSQGRVGEAENALKLEGKTLDEVRSKVVSPPTVTMPSSVAVDADFTVTMSATSWLDDNVSIDHYIVEYEGTETTVPEPSDGTDASVTLHSSANLDATAEVTVVAVDTAGNQSVPVTKTATIVESLPPTVPTVSAPESVSKNEVFTISLSGSTDPDGDAVSYRIVNAGNFAFAKTDNIAENEAVSVTAPDVSQNSTEAFVVVAVDATGLESDPVSVSVDVRNISYGTVDIFGDGSSSFYFPMKSNLSDLGGFFNLEKYHNSGSFTITYSETDGAYFQSDKYGLKLSPYLDMPSEFTVSFQGKVAGVEEDESDQYMFSPESQSDWNSALFRPYAGGDAGYLGDTNSNFASAIEDGDWHTYTIIKHSDNSLELFVDGDKRLDGSYSYTFNRLTTIAGGEGQNFPSSAYDGWRGYIKNVRAFSRALNSEEIQKLTQEV